jgi:hypothetical protein
MDRATNQRSEGTKHAMDMRLPPVAAKCRDHLHDHPDRQQAPEGVGYRIGESGTVAAMDRGDGDMGSVTDERGVVDRLRTESHTLENRRFVRAVLRAFDMGDVTLDEAKAAIVASIRGRNVAEQPAGEGEK